MQMTATTEKLPTLLRMNHPKWMSHRSTGRHPSPAAGLTLGRLTLECFQGPKAGQVGDAMLLSSHCSTGTALPGDGTLLGRLLQSATKDGNRGRSVYSNASSKPLRKREAPMEILWQDLRHSLRAMRRSPAFT